MVLLKEHNLNWSQILVHPYQILTVGGSGYGETNTLINLIKQQYYGDYNIIDKIYLYVKDQDEVKYQYKISKILSENMNKLVVKSVKIQRLLLNIQIICRMSIKIRKITT